MLCNNQMTSKNTNYLFIINFTILHVYFKPVKSCVKIEITFHDNLLIPSPMSKYLYDNPT